MYNMLIFLMGLLIQYSSNIQSITLNPVEAWPIVISYRFDNCTVMIHCRHQLEYLSVHVIKGRFHSRKIYELKSNELLDFLSRYKTTSKEMEAA